MGNKNPTMISTDYWTLNAVGVPDAGPEKAAEEISLWNAEKPVPLIANIIGLSAEEFVAIAKKIVPLQPDFLEVNLSTPTFLKLRGKLFAEDTFAAHAIAGVTKAGRKKAAPVEETQNWKPTNIKIDLPLDLLNSKTSKPTSGDIKANTEIIKNTLEKFGIPVEMGEISVGPTVTQYTFKPEEGIKLSRITALNNDLAMALAAHPVRIEAPIPGKALVGIEVPNHTIAVVPLREILESDAFKKRSSNLLTALGKDVAGQVWLDNIGKMPHLLVAGATGSGKSV
jgi:DNA segregation ATPase FtsK/SpoIIIE-like protein